MNAESAGGAAVAEFRSNGFVLVAAIIGLTAGVASTLFYSLGSFIPSLEEDFGWSRGDISLALAFTAAAIFLSGAFVGRLCDRFGSRRIATISLVAYAVGLAVMALTVVQVVQLWIAYFLVTLLGMGSTPIGLVKPVAAAFDRNRGLALGFALTGTALAGFWVPHLVTQLTANYGWRAGYLGLAGVALLAAPLVWIAFGIAERRSRTLNSATAKAADGMSMGEARRTARFWLLSAVSLAMALGLAGLIVHLVPLFRDLGADTFRAATLASLIGLSAIAGRLLIGFALDRLSGRIVALAVLGMAAAGALLIMNFDLVAAAPAVFLMGFAFGAEIDLIAYLTSRHFGSRAYAEIYGWQYGLFALGGGTAPFLVGMARDQLGSYDQALLWGAALLLLAGIAAAGLGPYRYGGNHAASRS